MLCKDVRVLANALESDCWKEFCLLPYLDRHWLLLSILFKIPKIHTVASRLYQDAAALALLRFYSFSKQKRATVCDGLYRRRLSVSVKCGAAPKALEGAVMVVQQRMKGSVLDSYC